MFLPSKYYIYKENDLHIEFREKKLKLYFGSLLLFAVGLACLLKFMLAENKAHAEAIGLSGIIISLIGVLFVIAGVVPALSVGKIVIDRKDKKLSFSGGIRKFIFSPLKVCFSQINRIEIKEEKMFRYGFALGWAKIILKLDGHNDVEIDHSSDDEYLNRMALKMSNLIGCGVYPNN